MAIELLKSNEVKTFALGEVIVAEGPETARDLALLLQGNVGVYRNWRKTNEQQVAVIRPGSFHGEMSLFLNRQQTETLVALTDAIVLFVGRRNVKQFFAEQPDTALTLVEGLCRRLDSATEELDRIRRGSQEQAASRRSSLFPPEHGSYTLPLANDAEYLYVGKTTCPLCDHSFESLGVLQSKLRLVGTDPDLRMRYRDFEPLYYEVVTCPNCFYSASASLFGEVSRGVANRVNEQVGSFKLEMQIATGLDRDTFSVFAGYYLAILCAPAAFDDHHLITSQLWLKLTRLYRDCGDEVMERYASDKALEDFRYVYNNLHISDKQSQQVCYIIGDLMLRRGDVDEGRQFFFMAKTNKYGTRVIERQAELRLEEIRELKQREKAEAERLAEEAQ